MEFLKTVLIILLVYFALKFLIKLAWPYIVNYMTKKAGEKLAKSFGQNPFENMQNQKAAQKKEGEVTIERPAATARKSNKNVGEYVDFEEVKD